MENYKTHYSWKLRKAYIDVVAEKLDKILQKNQTGLKVGLEENDLWYDPIKHSDCHYIYVMEKDKKFHPRQVCQNEIFIYPSKNIFHNQGEEYPVTKTEIITRMNEWIFDMKFYKELKSAKKPKIRNLDEVMREIVGDVNSWFEDNL